MLSIIYQDLSTTCVDLKEKTRKNTPIVTENVLYLNREEASSYL